MGRKLIDRTGETRKMNCGMTATIIRYGSTSDIDVQFDDGTVAKDMCYSAFVKGAIISPSLKIDHKSIREGETRMMNCGMKATIIRYGSKDDIDVIFKDGFVVKHKKYYNFIKGLIKNPNAGNVRIGETRMMNCGMTATIIRYGSKDDIDVIFKDGSVVKHKKYYNFVNGKIMLPSLKVNYKDLHIGETRMMNCGMRATIFRYGSSIDIDVNFEDGMAVKRIPYWRFKCCKAGHPVIKIQGVFNYRNFVCHHISGKGEEAYYLCECKKCGYKDIVTPHQMMLHNCQ